jgi:hypothetical protein
VWKIIRGILDPVVAAKVDFTRSAADLERHIPRENIIARIGGADEWEYTYIEPSEDDDALLSQTEKREEILQDRREIAGRLLAATQAWISHLERGEKEEAAIQQKLRGHSIEALAANYWKLDPYIRSRTLMDRSGVLKPDGTVDRYPERKKTAAAAATTAVAKETRAIDDTSVGVNQEVVAAAG